MARRSLRSERAARQLAATGQVAAAANYERLIPRARWLAGQAEALGALVGPGAHDGLEETTLDLAARARSQGRPALAARLAEVALAACPPHADDLRAGHRAAAARAAALAGSGGGNHDPPLDDTGRAELRRLAFGWLKADLAARRSLSGADPKSARIS